MGDAFAADEVGVELNLALQYAPAARRRDLLAVWRLDARLRRIFLGSRDPALGEIKMAWWEERLGALRTDAVPPEPLLRQIAVTSTIDVSDLVQISEGWRALFADGLPPDMLGKHAGSRGQGLMRAAAAALGGEPSEPMLLASEGYALVDLAGTRVEREERDAVLAAARDRFEQAGRIIWPRPLRPTGMIVELARGDAARGEIGHIGSPVRVARMAWHALTGR